MANNRIELYAYSYAYKIVYKVPGYTLSKAQSIFRGHFDLVQKYVTSFKEYEEAKKFANLSILKGRVEQIISAYNECTSKVIKALSFIDSLFKNGTLKITETERKLMADILTSFKNPSFSQMMSLDFIKQTGDKLRYLEQDILARLEEA